VTLAQELAQLFEETAAAHHRAFASTNGDDPAWAEWYAQHLRDRLLHLLGRPLEVKALAAELTALDAAHRREGATAPWPEYYAHRLLRRHGSS